MAEVPVDPVALDFAAPAIAAVFDPAGARDLTAARLVLADAAPLAAFGRADADFGFERARLPVAPDEAAGRTADIVFAAAVSAFAAMVMARVAVFIACIAVDMVLADDVALVAAVVIFVAADVTFAAADETVLAAAVGVADLLAVTVRAAFVPAVRDAG